MGTWTILQNTISRNNTHTPIFMLVFVRVLSTTAFPCTISYSEAIHETWQHMKGVDYHDRWKEQACRVVSEVAMYLKWMLFWLYSLLVIVSNRTIIVLVERGPAPCCSSINLNRVNSHDNQECRTCFITGVIIQLLPRYSCYLCCILYYHFSVSCDQKIRGKHNIINVNKLFENWAIFKHIETTE
jgi:hypothetical protein